MFTVSIRCVANDTKVVMTSLQLYKHLMRQCEKLPPDACKHYKFAVKQVILLIKTIVITGNILCKLCRYNILVV